MPVFLTLLIGTVLCSTTAQAVRTPRLILAIQTERMSFFRQLVRGDTDVNVINAIGRTAAHYAVEKNDLRALQQLIDRGADVNVADKHGKTLLDLWQRHENKEMLELLQKAGAQPAEEQQPATEISTEPDDVGKAQDLWEAAASNDVAAAKRLLAEGADAQATPFDVAVEAGHDALAAILLRAAAGINSKDKQGWTPLMWAIVALDWNLVRELLAEGADIVAGDRPNALDVANMMESEEKFVETFVAVKGTDYNIGSTPLLMWAAARGYMNTVKFLVEQGTDINAQDEYGNTALIRAARNGDMDKVKFLVEQGANINAQDKGGKTALMWAARERCTKIVKLLVELDADIDAQDKDGYTASSWAAFNTYTGILDILRAAKEQQALKPAA